MGTPQDSDEPSIAQVLTYPLTAFGFLHGPCSEIYHRAALGDHWLNGHGFDLGLEGFMTTCAMVISDALHIFGYKNRLLRYGIQIAPLLMAYAVEFSQKTNQIAAFSGTYDEQDFIYYTIGWLSAQLIPRTAGFLEKLITSRKNSLEDKLGS